MRKLLLILLTITGLLFSEETEKKKNISTIHSRKCYCLLPVLLQHSQDLTQARLLAPQLARLVCI